MEIDEQDRQTFDFAVSDKERRTFRVMTVFAFFAAVLFIVLSLDPVQSSFSYWELLRYYSLGMLAASIIAIVFIWFVNTDGYMVGVSSFSMFIVTICGFGIILVSIIQYILLPDYFNEQIFMLGLGLSTIVFALGI